MKKITLTAISLFISMTTMGIVSAQKVTEGSLAFLKGVDELHFNFVYKGMMIKKQTEQQYIAEQVQKKNQEEEGKGDEWKIAWETTEREYIQEVFIEDFNKEIAGIGPEGGNFPNAAYVATIETIELDPGDMGSPIKPSFVTVEITLTRKGSTKVLAKILISKAKGSLSNTVDTFSTDILLIGSSYGEAGGKLGEVIVKSFK
jgi:hypothetical protein